jgi:hypothetical protein
MAVDAKQLIEQVVRERLDGSQIVSVEVAEDEDCEGEGVYRVVVVYDEAEGLPDSHKTLALTRHTRSRLAEVGSLKFPIFRFLSQADAKRVRPAAA